MPTSNGLHHYIATLQLTQSAAILEGSGLDFHPHLDALLLLFIFLLMQDFTLACDRELHLSFLQTTNS